MGVYEIKQPSKFNALNIFLAAVLATIGYLAAWYLPYWWPVFQLGTVMRGICAEAYRQNDDEKLIKKLVKESRRTGLILTQEHFTFVRVPYSDLELQAAGEAAGVFKTRGKACHIEFDYTVRSEMPLSGKHTDLHFHREVDADLKIIQY